MKCIAVDRGHKHSDGASIVQIWLKGAFTKGSEIADSTEHVEGSEDVVGAKVAEDPRGRPRGRSTGLPFAEVPQALRIPKIIVNIRNPTIYHA